MGREEDLTSALAAKKEQPIEVALRTQLITELDPAPLPLPPQNYKAFADVKEGGYPSLSSRGEPDGEFTLHVKFDGKNNTLLYAVTPHTDDARQAVKALLKDNPEVIPDQDGAFVAMQQAVPPSRIMDWEEVKDKIAAVEKTVGADFGSKKLGFDAYLRDDLESTVTALAQTAPLHLKDYPELKSGGFPSLGNDHKPDGKFTLIVREDEKQGQLFLFIRPNTEDARQELEAKSGGKPLPYEQDGSVPVARGTAGQLFKGVDGAPTGPAPKQPETGYARKISEEESGIRRVISALEEEGIAPHGNVISMIKQKRGIDFGEHSVPIELGVLMHNRRTAAEADAGTKGAAIQR